MHGRQLNCDSLSISGKDEGWLDGVFGGVEGADGEEFAGFAEHFYALAFGEGFSRNAG